MSVQLVILLMIVGVFAGVLSGLVGVGGGIIVVPALVLLLGFTQKEAQGTSLGLLLLPVGILAVVNYYKAGYIDLKVVGIMALAFVIGGWIGSRLALTISEATVKKVFGILLLYTAVKMFGWDALLIKWVKGL